jgi:PucR family transcriptional regulator, purine catabolism regulatory protein
MEAGGRSEGGPPESDPHARLPTVGEILGLDAMKGSDVLAGRSGLDREVSGANIVEVPDVYRWLRGGELLFTAGYAWRGQPEGMVEVVRKLDRIGISALGIKLGRYLERVPDEVIAAADEMGLPLIRLAPDVPYREVIEPLYRRLTNQKLWLLERSMQAQEVFASLSLDDQSIEKVASALAEEVRNPVYVIDLVGDLAVMARPLGASSKVPLEAVSGDDGEIVRTIEGLTLRRTPMRMDLGRRRHALGASLIVGRRALGRIAVVESEAPLDEFVELALAHGAELISFLLMRQLAILEGRREAGGLFFDSLMSDELSNEEAAERAVTLGLRLTRPSIALVIGVRSSTHDDEEPLNVAVEKAMSSCPHVVGKATGEGGLVALFEPDESNEDASLDRVARRIVSLAEKGGLGEPLVGAGSARTGLAGVRRSRSEAFVAFQVASRTCRSGLVRFEDLKVERVLAQVPMSKLSEDYIAMAVGPLEDSPELLRTLESFLEHGGNKVATAAAIPLHRSSLAYRLEKISGLLGADLNDPETRLELWVALRLRRIFSLAAGER